MSSNECLPILWILMNLSEMRDNSASFAFNGTGCHLLQDVPLYFLNWNVDEYCFPQIDGNIEYKISSNLKNTCCHKSAKVIFYVSSYVDPHAVVGCEDGKVRVFDMYSRKISQIIKYVHYFGFLLFFPIFSIFFAILGMFSFCILFIGLRMAYTMRSSISCHYWEAFLLFS